MATSSVKWKEEQILIVCPGSQTTLASLGCAELSPPTIRVPTRMFRDAESERWRPVHTFMRRKYSPEDSDDDDGEEDSEVDFEYVEDPESDEGAVFPIQGEKTRFPRQWSFHGPLCPNSACSVEMN